MKKFRALLGIFILVAVMVSLFASASPVGAATTKSITAYIYKSPKVTNSDSTLKSYVTNAINVISDTSSSTDLSLTIKGPYLKSDWTGCYGSDPPKINGDPDNRKITVSFFKNQLQTNGYAGQSSGRALIDVDPNGSGLHSCNGKLVADWWDYKATTHEIAHIFDADDGCLTTDAMDKCGFLHTSALRWPAKEAVRDFLEDEW